MLCLKKGFGRKKLSTTKIFSRTFEFDAFKKESGNLKQRGISTDLSRRKRLNLFLRNQKKWGVLLSFPLHVDS